MPRSTDAEWIRLDEAAAAGDPAMPATRQGWEKIAAAGLWRRLAGKARREGKGWVYHLSLFPPSTQALLLARRRTEADAGRDADGRAELWQRLEALPDSHKAACRERLAAVTAAHRLMDTGMTTVAAVAIAAADASVSPSTLRTWLAAIRGYDRADWLAALAPGYRATAHFADCHPDAWAALKSDYLRPAAPGFSACYRRMVAAAAREGWSPIPSERALRRRLSAEVPAGVVALARKGAERTKAMFPAQRRSRLRLRAMSVVNIDGHRLDVFVRKGDRRPFRPLLVAIQDVYSGKFLGWRLDETENRVPVRLAIGDMVERYGIPDHMVLDNGRSFASKWITGGAGNRFRFKVRDDEPEGLLTQLGVEIHWALPFHGQAKPIERAFRDFCEDIARHPFCAGAYTGNSPVAKPEDYGARAIEWSAFRSFLDGQIAEHNARPGRTTETARGRSFDETFAASLAAPDTIVRWPTAEQRDLWLLMAEEITARRGNGEIHLLGNRYWSPAMVEHAGRKVHVRFDPDDLTRDVRVYDRKGRLLTTAQAIGDVDFLDADAAQRQARLRGEYQKTQRRLRDLHVAMKPDALGALYAPAARPDATPRRPAVTRLATKGNVAVKAEADWTTEHEQDFGSVVDLLSQRTARRGT